MIPKFKAWHKELKAMFEVKSLVSTLNPATIASKNDLFQSITCSFDDIILMQSTGLFDKNSKEIFEGDIVRFHTPQLTTIGVVEFDKNEGCFKVRNDFGGHYVTMFHTRYFEVIGNIYQNPELVEELK